MLDDLTTESTDRAVHSIAHGVIHLEQLAPDLRRRAAAPAGRQVPRPDRSAAAIMTSPSQTGGVAGLSAPGRGRAPHRVQRRAARAAASPSSMRCSAAASSAGSSTLMLGPGRHRQVAADPAIHRRRRRARRAGGAVRLRRGARAAVRARQGARASISQAMRDAGKLFIEQMDAAELSPGEFAASGARLRRPRRTSASS